MPFAVAYLPQNTATVIKFTNSFFFTNFDFLLLQKWEYQYKKIDKKQFNPSFHNVEKWQNIL